MLSYYWHRLLTGEKIKLDARSYKWLTICTEAGATATLSREEDDVLETATQRTGAYASTVAAATKLSQDVDWNFYLLSVTGGACEVSLGGGGYG